MKDFIAKGNQQKKEKEASQASGKEEAKQNKPKKKMVPKGKKRVMKERVTEDANGYTVVEEYSDYEDIPPEELEAQKEKAKEKQ